MSDASLLVFSVFDTKADAFLPPFFMATKGMALRAFMDAVADEKHQFRLHAADYSLFHLGFFDEKKGQFQNLAAPDVMALAIDLLSKTN